MRPRLYDPMQSEGAGTAIEANSADMMPVGSAPRLAVIGAAAGMGRWLSQYVFPHAAWGDVVLLDRVDRWEQLAEFEPGFGCPMHKAVLAHGRVVPEPSDGEFLPLATPGMVVCIAVPREALAGLCEWLVPQLSTDASIACVSATQVPSLAEVRHYVRGQGLFGVHPLVDSSARSVEGQTVLITADNQDDQSAHHWLVEVVERSGGIVKLVSADFHDRAMSYVQTMTHQSLLTFASAVSSSGLDLEELWALRTPLFEALFGLTTRVIAEGRQATVASIQVGSDSDRTARELHAAAAELGPALAGKDPEAVEALIARIRERYSGTLFETVQATASAAVTASQSKRAQLAACLKSGALVGLRPVSRPGTLRVGRIVSVSPVSVTLEELMIGKKGNASLLDGPHGGNASRVGLGGKARRTVFGLGHVDIVLGDELEDALDHWLVRIRRDIRFLVPESVAGEGVLAVVAGHPRVHEAQLVSEVVRTGQRSVVARVWVRSDHPVDELVEALRSLVQQTYEWPRGICLPSVRARHLHYLGPAGTFSEVAAQHALQSAGAGDANPVPHDGFDAVLGELGAGDLAILPISSSASGLVGRAVDALARFPGEIRAGGVIDVPVRFDAYIAPARRLADLRGAAVYSHPQGLAQCTAFIRRWGLTPVPCSSTAEALHVVAGTDAPAVAIAGADRGSALGLKVAEREVDDLSGSITRFLVLGSPGAFGELVGGSDPTLRHIWIAASAPEVAALMAPGQPAFDELLAGGDGRCMWVTSRPTPATLSGARYLGRAPWSPRTPVVRVEVR